ncbi:uncharacterized protein BXZ73DRAFT_97982 [Epithele typhae]|uniref:uncharacterized protein n=1 Tax=Epithele typhae TaxID=378194 RepID=UPI002008328E|nr:uncharacterized protein BXZ73DRAFT_97982 [Epithele typhae]KAH9941592.1 hypothetical protein BXZ73DRAFT_97982 [Epithele typhae]
MVHFMNPLLAAAVSHYAASSGYTGSNGAMSAWSSSYPPTLQTGCSLAGFTPSFPAGQSQLVAPTNPARFIGLAFGVQNYTCSQNNNYTAAGAVAELIDVSCIALEPEFATIQNDLFTVWDKLVSYPIQVVIDFLHVISPPEVLAQHYFVPNPAGQGLSPVWDFTSSGAFQGNGDAIVLAKGKGNIPAPTNATRDVAWLDVPPASCKYGVDGDLSVKYVSKYIFYGGSAQPSNGSSSSYSSGYSSATSTYSSAAYTSTKWH